MTLLFIVNLNQIKLDRIESIKSICVVNFNQKSSVIHKKFYSVDKSGLKQAKINLLI